MLNKMMYLHSLLITYNWSMDIILKLRHQCSNGKGALKYLLHQAMQFEEDILIYVREILM